MRAYMALDDLNCPRDSLPPCTSPNFYRSTLCPLRYMLSSCVHPYVTRRLNIGSRKQCHMIARAL